MTLKLRYSSIDGFSQSRTFKTVAGAEAFVTRWLGQNFDRGGSYLVAGDGVGKIDNPFRELVHFARAKMKEAA